MTCATCGFGYHPDCLTCQSKADALAARIAAIPTLPYKPMAQSVAERQRAFKEAMKEAGFVRLEAYVTKGQREKFRRLGGDEWLRKKIEKAKEDQRG